MESRFFSWIKRIGTRISENKPQHITNPLEFYLICKVKGYQGKYDGKRHSIELTTRENCQVRYSLDEKNWSDKKPEIKDVCERECYIRVLRNKRIEETKVVICIRPRNLKLISKSACKEYDGKSLSSEQIFIAGDGLAEGDKIFAIAVGKRTLVGKTENEIQYSFENDRIVENYIVESEVGEITIKDRKDKYSICLQGKNGDYLYDGYEHQIEGFEKNIFLIEGIHYYVSGIKMYASLCNAGTIKAECVGSASVKDESGNDVTSQFNVEIISGILKINKRSIELVSDSIEKEYDGSILSCPKYWINGDGLAVDDKLVVLVESQQLLVGSCENAIRYYFEKGCMDNYNIKTLPGTISVNNRREKYLITLNGKRESVLYNGYEQELEGFETYKSEINGHIFLVDGVRTSAEGNDAGVYKGNVYGTPIVKDKYGNDVTKQFEVGIIPCELEIRKRNIEIKSGSARKEYDGAILACGEYQISGDNIVSGDLIFVKLLGKKLLIGETANTISYQFINERTANNYNVAVKAGTLSIFPRKNKFQIKLIGNSEKIEYDGCEHKIEGFKSNCFYINDSCFYVEGLKAIGVTSMGTAIQNISGDAVVIDSFGNDVTDQFDIDVEPGSLQVIDRQTPYTITIKGKSLDVKYDGTEQILEDQIDFFFEEDSHQFHISGLSLKATGIHVGSKQTETQGSLIVMDMFGNNVTREFSATIIPGTLTILPREVTIVSASAIREYNGDELKKEEIEFVGDKFLPDEVPTITFEGGQNIVGKCENRFSFMMPIESREEDYFIQVKFGTLEVVDRLEKFQLDFQIKNWNILYDGQEHLFPDKYEDIVEVNKIPFKMVVSYNSNIVVHAGTYPLTIKKVIIWDLNDNDVTDQFETNILSGSFTILKRTLGLRSESIDKEYDGTELRCNEILVSGDGFAEGEGFAYSFLNSQLLPGTAINEFNYFPNYNTCVEDYDVTCTYGRLTVMNCLEPICIEIYGESQTYLYDGKEKTLPEYETLSFEYNGEHFYISGISNQITGVEEGKYTSKSIDNYHVCDGNKDDVTEQFHIIIHPGILTIEHNTTANLVSEENKEQGDIYDMAAQKIIEKMTGEKETDEIKKISRKELADRFTDNKELIKGTGVIEPKYASLLSEKAEHDKLDVLRNRIVREFKHVTLLSEIEISDGEFKLLMYYFKKKYEYVRANYKKPFVDILFAVAMVQIGIRYYENNFWPQVCIASNIESIGLNDRNWIGGSVTGTLLAFGKPVYEKKEYVTNVMMHCFITDAFANRFFDYLFKYYQIDLDRDISGLQEIDLEYLCKCIINPYTKRQQLLSDYAAMSVRADREYCKEIISKSLTMIDRSFWDEDYPDKRLNGRLAKRFEEWKEVSKFYNLEKKKQNDLRLHDGVRRYRKPRLVVDVNNGIFRIILPSQIVPESDIENAPSVTWFVISRTQRQFSGELIEGFSGYLTREIEFAIEREAIFDKYIFLLFANNELLRSFVWKEKHAQFFRDDGRWVAGTNLEEGRTIAFVQLPSKIDSKAIQYQGVELGFQYYEMNLHNGDFVCVTDEDNYYVGDIPKTGLSEIGIISDVSVSMKENQDKIKVYSNYPEIVIEIEENEFKGTAIIANNTVNKLSQVEVINVRSGKVSAKKYYFINAEALAGIELGYNRIIIDYPQSRKRIDVEFFIVKDFRFEFQDAPYVFKDKGILKINRHFTEGMMGKLPLSKMDTIEFQMSDLDNGVLTIPENDGIKMNFDVPMLYISWDRKTWLFSKPDDIWHRELSRIIYLKYPEDQLKLFVEGQEEKAVFNYRKKADGIFDCDITKMLSHFSTIKICEAVVLKTNSVEQVLFRILQKSFLVNAVLQSNYDTHRIEAQLDIVGKGSYFADLYCNDEIIAEKEPVSEKLQAFFDVETETADYTIKVFESDDEFGFDGDYDFVGEKSVALLNPADLLGGCMKIVDVVDEKNHTEIDLDNNYRYYIYLEERYGTMKYKAILVGIFYKENYVMYASKAIVEITDINNAETIVMERLNESDKIEEFYYNSNKKAIVDQKYLNNNQQLIKLNKQSIALHVEVISPNRMRKNEAIKWINERKERSKKKFSIWKEE